MSRSSGLGAIILLPALAALFGIFKSSGASPPSGGGGGSEPYNPPPIIPLPPGIPPDYPQDPEDPYYPYYWGGQVKDIILTPGITGLSHVLPIVETLPTGGSTVETSGWHTETPQGSFDSREPTEEERDTGQCPEIPGIWDPVMQQPFTDRFCSNPNCPSNQDPAKFDQTLTPGTISPTPAMLISYGLNKGYYCPVCYKEYPA